MLSIPLREPEATPGRHEFFLFNVADGPEDRELIEINVNGEIVVVARVGSEFFAFDPLCTHQEARMCDGLVEDGMLECPLHGGRFDLLTGVVIDGPRRAPLPTYPVVVRKDAAWITLDDHHQLDRSKLTEAESFL